MQVAVKQGAATGAADASAVSIDAAGLTQLTAALLVLRQFVPAAVLLVLH
jgi:hypothetical protein